MSMATVFPSGKPNPARAGEPGYPSEAESAEDAEFGSVGWDRRSPVQAKKDVVAAEDKKRQAAKKKAAAKPEPAAKPKPAGPSRTERAAGAVANGVADSVARGAAPVTRTVRSTADKGAATLLGFVLWCWVGLPLIQGGPSRVADVWRAKWLNQDSKGKTLP